MIYVSLYYYLFIGLALIVYYLVPIKHRWYVLLVGNISFYYFFYKKGWWIFLATILLSYLFGRIIEKSTGLVTRKVLLSIALLCVVLPWLFIKKDSGLLLSNIFSEPVKIIAPLGISFYTLQIVSYLSDIYMAKISAEKNFAKYVLFVGYFPQLIQGPMPRYQQLQHQLVGEHPFDEKKFSQGFCYIIWGFFLKLVIADKAGTVVNTVFDNYQAYTGAYLWLAAVLYSIQLYADFLACTKLAQGVSKLFGIELVDNFRQPYLSVSVKDFWRRWHISLSEWLRDYIYIPLGGNRKGVIRKYLFLIITFAVSGVWHGSGYKFLFWGLMHAGFQIVGDVTNSAREKAYDFLHVSASKKKFVKQVGTFCLVSLAWIIFRANSLRDGLAIIKHMFTDYNPWVLFNDYIFALGLVWKEFLVLVVAIVILICVGVLHEKGRSISDRILMEKLAVRWIIYIVAILSILIFGSYGFGFNSSDFIYGGF